MAALAGRPILTVGDTTYHWEDLVLCGHLWGDWPALQQRVATGLACLARLDELEEGDDEDLDEKDVEAAAEEFRYARDLVAAEDMEAWLAHRGLDADEWLDCIRRGLLLAKWADDLDAIVEEFEVEPADVEAVIDGEAICTNVAASLATRLAGRAAIHARLAQAQPGDAAAEADVQALLEGLPGLPAGASRQRLESLARLELAWRRFTETQVTPAALRSLVDTNRLDWIRLTVRTVTVATRDVANEIALCVRDDGEDFLATCAQAGQRVTEATWFVDETDGRLRDALVAARAGDLLGPVPIDQGFILVAVLSKVLPVESDPEVRQRAERALLDRLVAREIQDRVTWHETL
jgi:hypothetical protein